MPSKPNGGHFQDISLPRKGLEPTAFLPLSEKEHRLATKEVCLNP
jgi:hypothetical protein